MPIISVLCRAMSKASEDGLIELLGFVICMRMVRRGQKVLEFGQRGHCCKVFDQKFCSIVGEEIHRDAVGKESIIREEICSMCTCCFRCSYCSR